MTDLEFRKLMKDNFTRDQIIWFASNGSYNPDNTEGEIKADVARQLFDAKMDKTPDQTDKLLKLINGPKQTYDLQTFAQAAGFKDQTIGKKKLTAADQFYASYPNASRADKELWNAGITGVFGDDGLDKLDRVLASEKRNREYDAKRKFDNRSTVSKIFDAVVAPRQTEARLDGREPSDTDKYLDRTENVLMSLPFMTGAKVISNIPKIPRLASLVLKGGGYAAANAGVPHAMEWLDSKFYTPEENVDRSIYSEGDAAIGTMTNIAAPYVLNRLLRGKLGRFVPEGVKGETPGLSETEFAQVKNAMGSEWKKPSKATQIAVKEFNRRQNAGSIIDAAMPEFHEGIEKYTNTPLEWARAQAIAKQPRKSNAVQDYLEAGFVEKAAEDHGLEPYKVLAEAGDQLEYLSDVLDFSDDVLKNADVFDLIKLKYPKVGTAAKGVAEGAGNFVTNKYGSKRDADIILGSVSRLGAGYGLDVSKKIKEAKDKAVEEARTELKKSQAAQILSTDKTLTEEDKDWLAKLAKKPNIIEGYGEGGSTKFKNWFLVRGQDILRGTELFRPTYDVE